MTKISIYERMDDGRWLTVGKGRLDGNRIVDCAADIGDDVYGALEGAIEYVADTGHVVPGSYQREVGGTEYRIDVELCGVASILGSQVSAAELRTNLAAGDYTQHELYKVAREAVDESGTQSDADADAETISILRHLGYRG